MQTLALLLAGGRGSRLDVLSNHRPKPSVPFGGRFKLIDFALSNCVNSGIYNIGILTQYLPRSLHEHIGIGTPWDLDRYQGGVDLLSPSRGGQQGGSWYQGTAHAVAQNVNYIKRNNPDYVIILSADHIYKMDYSKLIKQHQATEADLTIAAQRVSEEAANRFGILDTKEDKAVANFVEKPNNPPNNLASMGIYVFNTETLLNILNKCCTTNHSDFGHHIIPPLVNNKEVYAYEFNGYWRDVGTIDSLWETNLALTDDLPQLNLYEQEWPIYTRDKEQPPVKFGSEAESIDSIISNGAVIKGTVINSVISPGVVVGEGAVVEDSVIFDQVTIKKKSRVSKTIIDSQAVVSKGCQVGFGSEQVPNHDKPSLLSSGLSVIGQKATIPAETTIGCNCRLYPGLSKEDFAQGSISSGETITDKKDRTPSSLNIAN